MKTSQVKSLILSVLCLSAFVLSGRAEEDAHRAKARQLMVLNMEGKSFADILDAKLRESMKKMPTKGLSPEGAKELQEAAYKFFKEHVDGKTIEERFVSQLAAAFTEAELDELIRIGQSELVRRSRKLAEEIKANLGKQVMDGMKADSEEFKEVVKDIYMRHRR